MRGFEDSPTPKFLTDIETLRRQQRQEREAGIRARQDRDALNLSRLKASGVLPADDLLFRGMGTAQAATPAVADVPVAQDSGWDRKAVFAHLNSGASRESLPSECAGYIGDYDASKHLWQR